MTPRTFVAAIGLLTASVALIFLLAVPITLTDQNGTELRCGTAVSGDEYAARDYAQDQLRRQLETGDPGDRPDCDGASTTRMAWTIPLAAVGAIAAFGALFVRPGGGQGLVRRG